VGALWRRFLRLAFRLLYNELAWTYDLVAWLVSLGQWKAWGRTALDHVGGAPVLELGHGPGHLLAEMGARGLSAVGVDTSVHMGRLAKRRLAAREVPGQVVRARAQELPFRDRAFRSAVATFPAEFIVEPATIAELSRVLAIRGRLVSVLLVRLAGSGSVVRLLRYLYRVTGQSGPFPRCEYRLRRAGFEPSWIWQRARRAELLMLIAEKRRGGGARLGGRTGVGVFPSEAGRASLG
jgi:ubiquinone/menaquinone biosynthesis C-methylase UbiE